MASSFLVQSVLGTAILLNSVVSTEFQGSFKTLLEKVEGDRCTALTYADSSAPGDRARTLAMGNAYCRSLYELLLDSPDYEQGDCFTGTDPECSEFKYFYKSRAGSKRTRYRCAVTVPGLLYGTRKVSIHSCVKGSLILYKEFQAMAYKNLKRKRAIENSYQAASNLNAYQFYETESGFKGQAPAALYQTSYAPRAGAPGASPSRRTNKRQRVTFNSGPPGPTGTAAPRDDMRGMNERVDEILLQAQREVNKKRKKRSRATSKSRRTWKSWLKKDRSYFSSRF